MTIDTTEEVEYVVALDAAKEAIWMKSFTIELDVVPLNHLPLFCVNNGFITRVKESRSSPKV